MKKQGFIKGSAILIGMVIVTKILGLIYKIPLTNILGGTGMGYFAAVFSVYTPVFALAAAGIPSAVARLTAENYALGRFSNLRRLRTAAHLTFGATSLLACGLLIVLSAPLGARVLGSPSVKYALMAIAPSVIFSSAMAVEKGYFEGLRNMLPTAVSEIAEAALKLVFGLALAGECTRRAEESFAKTGAVFGIACENARQAADTALPFVTAAAISGATLASAAACLVTLITARISGDGLTEKMLASDPVRDSWRRHMNSLLRLSTSMSVTAVIITLMSMLDMLVIAPCIRRAAADDPAAFKGLTDLGVSLKELPHFLYGSYQGLAILLYGMVPTLTAMFGKSSLAQLTACSARGDQRGFSRALGRMLTVSGLIAAPGGLCLTLLAEPVLELIFPGRAAEVTAAAGALEILGVSAIFYSMTLPCFTVLQALGKPARAAGIMLLGGGIRLALELCLIPIPRINIRGAAMAELCSSVTVCILTLRAVCRLGGVRPGIAETCIKPLYSGLMCAMTAKLSFDVMSLRAGLGSVPAALTAAAAGGIMYVISLVLLCEMPKNIKNWSFVKKSSKTS